MNSQNATNPDMLRITSIEMMRMKIFTFCQFLPRILSLYPVGLFLFNQGEKLRLSKDLECETVSRRDSFAKKKVYFHSPRINEFVRHEDIRKTHPQDFSPNKLTRDKKNVETIFLGRRR